MGLSEKTRYVLAQDLRPLLEQGGELRVDQVRSLLLSLDRYRRELQVSIKRHACEQSWLEDQVEQGEREVARWQHRLVLARAHAPAHVAEAQARLEKARATTSEARERQVQLSRAVANLKVGFDRVERALRLVRRKKCGLLAGERQGADVDTLAGLEAAALLAEELCPACGADPGAARAEDPVEDLFETLELQEFTDCLRRENLRREDLRRHKE